MTDGLKRIKKPNNISWREGAVLLFLIVVFAGIFLIGGVKTYPDTDSYLKMSPNREPGYALLLNAVTALFKDKGFFVLGILQNAFAVFAVYRTAVYIGSVFREKAVLYLTVLCLLLPYVVTPFFAASGIILTNAMISEGVTLSLYNLYTLSLLKAVWEEQGREKNLGIALLLSLLLAITRGQMTVTLIAWLITTGVLWIKERNGKKACGTVLLFVLAVVFQSVFVSSYNLLVNGVYTGTTYGDVTILSNVIYVADKEDGEAIEEEKLRQLFYEIYDIAESGHMLYRDAPEVFSEEAAFYSDMHDDIKDFAIYPTLQQFVEKEEQITDYVEKCIRVDSLASRMTRELLPECMGVWFSHYLRNVAAGLIRTVAFVHPLFNIPSFLGYAVLIGLGIFLYRKDRKSKVAKLLALTALLTAGNVAAVALTIMCLSRYMIYNMAFVYISALLLFTEMWRRRKRRKKFGSILPNY